MHEKSIVAGGYFQPRHLYSQIRDEIARRIAEKLYLPGSALPNEFTLSSEMGVSIGTIRKAVDMLIDEKLLERRHGQGTFVVNRNSSDFRRHFDRIRNGDGRSVEWTSRVLGVAQRAASELEQRVLRLRPAAEVIEIHRLRESRGFVLKREQCRLPAAIFGSLMDGKTDAMTIESLCVERNIVIGAVQEWLSQEPATDAIAADLKVSAGAKLFRLERSVYDEAGRPLEWRIAHCDLDCGFYHASSCFGPKLEKQLLSAPPSRLNGERAPMNLN